MLQPYVTVKQNALWPDRLRLDDLTPVYNLTTYPGGYGTPNIARSEVDFVAITLTSPDERDWYTGPLAWTPNLTFLDLRATDFQLLDSQATATHTDTCGCNACAKPISACDYARGPLAFTDGIYSLTYEVWGKKGIPAEVTSYHLDVPFCEGEQIWMERQGAWFNATSLNQTTDRGRYFWSALSTTLLYGYYEVRQPLGNNCYRVNNHGRVTKVVTLSPSGLLTTSTDSTLIGATTIRYLLTGVVARKMADLALRPLPKFDGYDVSCDALAMLAVSKIQLDVLTTENRVDETTPVLLDSIVYNVTYLQNQLSPTYYSIWQ